LLGDVAVFAAVIVGSYLIGGLPFAYIVGRVAFKRDIREHGSGNVGATNVFRVFGPVPAAVVLVTDAVKGFAPVAIAALVGDPSSVDWLMVVSAMAAILGHSYSPYLGFSGGKGVATAAGALLRLTPISVAILVVVFAVIVVLTRIVSIGSVTIALGYPITVAVFYGDRPVLLIFSVVAVALVLWRHRSNIRRIARGEEKRIVPPRRMSG